MASPASQPTPSAKPAGKTPLLQIRRLKKYFPLTRGVLSRVYAHVKAVDDVSFDIYPGETLGLVGESGSGKTTIGRCILRLIEPTSGEVKFEGHDILSYGREKMRRLRRQIVNNSALYNLFRTVRGVLRARESRIIHGRPEKFREFTQKKFEPAQLRPSVDAYGDRLRELARRIVTFGARPIFVTQLRGDVFDIGGRTLVSYSDSYNEREKLLLFNAKTMEVCRAVGGICVDLGAELHLKPNEFYDRLHTLPSGSRKIGRYLHSRLRDKL